MVEESFAIISWTHGLWRVICNILIASLRTPKATGVLKAESSMLRLASGPCCARSLEPQNTGLAQSSASEDL